MVVFILLRKIISKKLRKCVTFFGLVEYRYMRVVEKGIKKNNFKKVKKVCNIFGVMEYR